ncbi:MAG: RNA polymerase sigma factor [Hyphomicrobiaceae bacterium]
MERRCLSWPAHVRSKLPMSPLDRSTSAYLASRATSGVRDGPTEEPSAGNGPSGSVGCIAHSRPSGPVAIMTSTHDRLIIMTSLPFGLAGGLWAVYLAGYNLSVAVAVGFIALGGIAVEAAVVMLLYIDTQVREKPPQTLEALKEAIMAGAVMRVRPKLMTVLTIIAGLLALAVRVLGDRSEAEDVAQDVFLRIWQQAPHWRPGTPRFDTWMHRVALNLCYDRLRLRREQAMADPPDQIDPGPAPDHGLHELGEKRQIAAALVALPDRQREAIVLQYFQELSNIEVAGIMGISVEALESLLARARRNLRAHLQQQDVE